jgi:hypothetical protein
MRLYGRVPTVEEATKHFQDMVLGKLPRRQSGQGRRRSLFGSWYAGSSRSTHPRTTLVTPVAADIEQARSKLRQTQGKTRKRKRPSQKGGAKRVRQQPQHPRKKRQVKKKTQRGGARTRKGKKQAGGGPGKRRVKKGRRSPAKRATPKRATKSFQDNFTR